ncbi:alpha/beta hydrolase family protein [Paenibacillus sp. MBLB4367]|uniref:alpha/beta hydrolase family protein n=1 Tax=Paenibacillus sp. MBLB4367 TaxID=3384767 RepID=UPI0039083581
MEHTISIRTANGSLAGTLHYPTNNAENETARPTRHPLVIICHGFIGNRIGVDRLFVKAARSFSAQGYMVLRFDYEGCGESEGEYGEGGLDSLIEQTRSALDYGLSIDCVDPSRVVLLGHSLGGAVALLTAAQDKRVKTLVLWAAVAHPLSDIVRVTGKRVYEEAKQIGRADHSGYAFTPDFFASLSRHHPLEQTRKFTGDVLLVHGTGDEVIPVDYCFLYEKLFWLRSQGQCDKEVILQANHTFSTIDHTDQLLERTGNWLKYIRKRNTEWLDWTI